MSLSAPAQAVVELIRQRDHVTFVEIERCLASHLEAIDGPLALELSACPNLILWDGMSAAFMRVMQEVQQSGLVQMESTAALTYLIDGKTLRLPIAKKPPPGGYKKSHWAPVYFRLKDARPTRRPRKKTP